VKGLFFVTMPYVMRDQIEWERRRPAVAFPEVVAFSLRAAILVCDFHKKMKQFSLSVAARSATSSITLPGDQIDCARFSAVAHEILGYSHIIALRQALLR